MFYLKYRPQTIGELDNIRIKETLGKSLLENNWAHAYLLIGTRGSGKTTTARLIAKIVNCTGRKYGEEPCNKCDSCLAVTKGNSFDVIEIDGASNTSVEDIRDLREKVKLAPASGKYKVYIIDEVHMLSTSAFNALLKTLEEPPAHVIFVLATTDPQKLPETITSRCMVYDFSKATSAEIINGLQVIIKKEKIKIDEDALARLSELAKGSHRDAAKLLEQLTVESDSITLAHLDALNRRDITTQVKVILNSVADGEISTALNEIGKFSDDNGKAKDLQLALINYLRQVLLKRSGVAVEIEEIKIDSAVIQSIINDLIMATIQIKESPIPQLPIELIIIKYTSPKTIDIKPETSVIPSDPVVPVDDVSQINVKWPEILVAVKPFNHSIAGLLRGAKPKGIHKDTLVIEVFYKFHKEKLSEVKNREILEGVVSDIMGQPIKIKFELKAGE